MKNKCKIVNSERLVNDIYKVTFDMGECEFRSPGQYAIIGNNGDARPYQVCEFDSNRFTIVFPANEPSSKALSELVPGDDITVVDGLGRGFDLEKVPEEVCLVANSMGIPEMLGLARSLLVRGKKLKLILEYPSKQDIYMLESFRDLVNEIEVLTVDGSNGREGRASDIVKEEAYICAGGSSEMLKALSPKCRSGQFSFSSALLEKAPAGGDLTIPTISGRASIREDGPVFDKDSIDWESLGK